MNSLLQNRRHDHDSAHTGRISTIRKSNPFLLHNNIHIHSVTTDQAVVFVNLTQDSYNAAGYVHGGLLSALIDVAASQVAMADGRNYVTQNSTVNYISNIQLGRIIAQSSVVKRGRKTVIAQVDVRSDEQKLLANAYVTMMCLNP